MLEYLRGSEHLRSLETLKRQTKNLLAFFKGREVNGLTGQDIKAYCRQRKDQGRANATINRELAALSSAINHCNREWEWDLPNPVKGRMLREPHHRERYLTRAEAGRLIAVARQQRSGDILADFIEVAVYTGCRRGELLNLDWARVDLTRGVESITLNARHTKSGKPRVVPLNANAASAIKRRATWRAENAPQSPWVFARPGGGQVKSLRSGFEKASKSAGLEDLRIHDLRHTAASWLVTDGVPLEVVKELLGHSSITMTERYAHLAPHRVREAVNRLGHNPVTPENLVRRDNVLEFGKS
ncbi:MULTISPECIES: site-specific integrase [unclassified Halomonas]|uniref:Tyrosine-type recombinase/integrase n=1 Tax=Halomonas sp. RT37 TaxID=2950872 RepID=A0AAU7KDH7_9GAMM|nr:MULTISPECIES: site-specific integrase [unclassified Halomonas]MBR9878637.1 tyrosine-type recombinase/integrase [Gammaproteobacteria bacterium]MBY5942818.1 tyrosine-type recombinase/integrase [Halomonas sp. DP5N14-9]MCO7217739.1 tyrosine-type recombinase/integrase [Halomonas sp. OfavH-34-E]|tara:strand:+ start:472 stop:1371 length:900 start_codon:yes stop_codon:yes gene_type:complete